MRQRDNETKLKNKRHVGRPSQKELSKTGPKTNWKMTEDVLQKLYHAFGIGCTIRQACAYADLAESTFYEWTKTNKELSEKFERLKENPILRAKNTVFKGVGEDAELAFKYLKAKLPDEFKESIELEHKSIQFHIVKIIDGIENDNTNSQNQRQVVEDAESLQD